MENIISYIFYQDSSGWKKSSNQNARFVLISFLLIVRLKFTLVVVVGSFFLCWTPFHAQRLMFTLVTFLGVWDEQLATDQHVLFIVAGQTFQSYCSQNHLLLAGVFYYFHSILNPIIYSLLSKRYRRAFIDMARDMMSCLSDRTSTTQS